MSHAESPSRRVTRERFGRPYVTPMAGLALLACSTGNGNALQGSSSGGSGGSTPSVSGGSSSTGGSTGNTPDSGSLRLPIPGRVTTPNPLISVNQPVVASPSVTVPAALVDGDQKTVTMFGTPTPEAPAWVAIQVPTGPSRLLLLWSDAAIPGPYNRVGAGAPAGYRVEVSPDSTDGIDGTWTPVVTVQNNPVRAREHSFEFSGHQWVKLVITEASVIPAADAGAADAATGAVVQVRLSELALYDISAAGTERPSDTWFFLGDSITQGAFAGNLGSGHSFSDYVQAAHPGFFPAMINGGVTAEYARHGLDHLEKDQWLDLNPDLKFIAIGYGTNDSWGNKLPANVDFAEKMEAMVKFVLDAGRVPIMAQIPYASQAHDTVQEFNQVIEGIRAKYNLPCGPDLYTWFGTNSEDLSSDGVHPNGNGYVHMNQRWAEAVDVLYPAN
jgi:acyl-CoA thioesterase-1